MKFDSVAATQFFRVLRGSTNPILAQANDGQTYILKYASAKGGKHGLFNEVAGSELFRKLSLNVATWRPVLITPEFLAANSSLMAQDGLEPNDLRPGVWYGSRFVTAPGHEHFEILPASWIGRIQNILNFWRAWLADICADHADNRQAVFIRAENKFIDGYFIDHGQMFGGIDGEASPKIAASRYLDDRIYQPITSAEIRKMVRSFLSLDAEQLRQDICTMPSDWISASALSALDRCLDRFADQVFLENAIESAAAQITELSQRRASRAQQALSAAQRINLSYLLEPQFCHASKLS